MPSKWPEDPGISLNNPMKKRLLTIIAVAIVAGGAGFYGGLKYSQSKTGRNFAGNFQNMANLSDEERQQRMQEMSAANIAGRVGGNRSGAGFASGEIISKDDKSITVKLRDGGSKIIILADSTEISKFASGEKTDLEVGKQVSVSGTANQDGSITAQSIQLRPENQTLPSGTPPTTESN